MAKILRHYKFKIMAITIIAGIFLLSPSSADISDDILIIQETDKPGIESAGLVTVKEKRMPKHGFEMKDLSLPKLPDITLMNTADHADEGESLTLAGAVITALINNPNIDSMINAVGKSEYLHASAAKEWLPVLSVDYSFDAFINAPKVELDNEYYPVVTDTFFIWGTHVKMPLYTGGALQYKKAIAALGIDVSKMRLLETKADLVQEVTINYFKVLRLQNYRGVIDENLISFKKHEDTTRKFFYADMVPKNMLLEIQAKTASANQELIVVGKNLKLAEAALNVSMGVDIDTHFSLEEITSVRRMPVSTKECYAIAERNNPSLVAFNYLKEIAEREIDLNKSKLQPQVSAKISYYKHGRTPALDGDDYLSNDILMTMITAEWNIFEWGKTRDLTQAKKKELEGILDRRKALTHRVSFDIKGSHLNMDAARNMFAVARKEIEYAEENYRITKLRYDERIARSTRVNDALVLLKRAYFHYYNAFYKYNVALAKLERVMGTNIRSEWR